MRPVHFVWSMTGTGLADFMGKNSSAWGLGFDHGRSGVEKGMELVVQIAHDFTCPWCWIAHQQVKELSQPGVYFDWVGYELWPETLAWPEPVAPPVPSRRPPTPSRLELAYAAAGMEPPTAARPKRMRIHNALEAVEYAKTINQSTMLLERLYRGLWEEGLEINDIGVILELATGLVPDVDDLETAIKTKRFEGKIVPFDDQAYEAGVFNVPTFFVGEAMLAEQPTSVLRRAITAALGG